MHIVDKIVGLENVLALCGSAKFGSAIVNKRTLDNGRKNREQRDRNHR